jgi:hypothetical protein
VFYSSFNGTSWSTQQIAAGGHATNDAPAIAPLPSAGVPLAIAWTEPSGAIGYGVLTFLGFSFDGTVPQAGTNARPALAFLGNSSFGTLYLAWKGTNSDGVFYSADFDLPHSSLAPSTWTPQETVPGALTSFGPALATAGYDVFAGWHGKSTSDIWYSFTEDPF